MAICLQFIKSSTDIYLLTIKLLIKNPISLTNGFEVNLFLFLINDFFRNRCSVYQEDTYDKSCFGAFIPENINSVF
jgi:hypothetical protein